MVTRLLSTARPAAAGVSRRVVGVLVWALAVLSLDEYDLSRCPDCAQVTPSGQACSPCVPLLPTGGVR